MDPLDKARSLLTDAFGQIPEDKEHIQATLAIMLDGIRTFAQMGGPELQKFWAENLYGVADELAQGEPLNDRVREYLRKASQ